jgi:hypothetical protein
MHSCKQVFACMCQRRRARTHARAHARAHARMTWGEPIPSADAEGWMAPWSGLVPPGAPARRLARQSLRRAPAGARRGCRAPTSAPKLGLTPPVLAQMWERRAAVPVQMWEGRAESSCKSGSGEPSTGANVAGVSPFSAGADEGTVRTEPSCFESDRSSSPRSAVPATKSGCSAS